MDFKVASRKRAKLRVGLFGASGSGKTMGALRLAYGLTGDWSKILVIDTENDSASLYADLTVNPKEGQTFEPFQIGAFRCGVLQPPFEPERYVNAITEAERAGAEVVIIDSISHEWNGRGGCLELVEKVQNSNSHARWAAITPRHNAFIDKILRSSVHVICCGRSKDDVDYTKNEKGKIEIQKVGLKAITRDGFDYEMTLCFDVDKWHQATSSKDRTGLFDGKPSFVIDETVGRQLIEWLNTAAEPEAETPPQAAAIPAQTSLPERVSPPQAASEESTTDPREALKREIEKERQRLGLTWLQVWERAGLTLTAESTILNMQEVLRRLMES